MATAKPKYSAPYPFDVAGLHFDTGDAVPPQIAELPHVAHIFAVDVPPTPEPQETKS